MANIFKRIFGAETRKPEIPGLDMPKSLTDFPTGDTLNKRILAALNQGQNIGFPEGYVDKSTSPFVASRESGFRNKELPFINEQFGARGLSRSTLAARGVNDAFAQKERDINELIANAYLQDLTQRKTDTARYEGLAGDFAGKEAQLKANATLAARAAAMEDYELGSARDKQNTGALNRMIATGLAVGAAPFTSGQSLMAVPGIMSSNSGGGGGMDMGMMTSILNYMNASPFTSTATTTSYGKGATGTTTPYFLNSKWGGRG